MIGRILELIEEQGIKPIDLVNAIKINKSAITEWKQGKSKPGTDAVIKIAEYFSVTTDWILTGKGPKYVSAGGTARSDIDVTTRTADEAKLINDYRSLNNDGKEYLRQTMEMIVTSDRYKKYVYAPDVEVKEKIG